MTTRKLEGIFAAALTPLNADFSPALDQIPRLLEFLAQRGCHGALLLGTTGEGPSFAAAERLAIFEAACQVRQVYPDFRLLAGTGTPSLEETIALTKAAFDLGYEAAVVLPPYYFRQATEQGLFLWFSQVLRRAVPGDGSLLGYHFPAQAGVPLSTGLLTRLREAFPAQFAGIKDSSTNAEHVAHLGADLDEHFTILVGNDTLFSNAIQAGASGCITALANAFSPLLREIWEAHQRGETSSAAQARLDACHTAIDPYKPYPAPLKTLLTRFFGLPPSSLRPPLLPLAASAADQLVAVMAPLIS